MHLGVLHGVFEADFVCVKADAAVGVGAGRAVLEVALDGATDIAKLAAYLVVAACQQFDLHKVIALCTF